MTSASALEARKQIALGWSRIKLDPRAALKNFEAAITADPRSAAVRVQCSKSRLAAGAGAAADGRGGSASAPAGPQTLPTRSPKGWAVPALIAALFAALGGVIAPLILKRRSGEDGSPPR